MFNKNLITFIIFTYNEEKRITYPIKCFLPYGRVLIVDNFSIDKTAKVAEKAGADVIKYKNDGWVETEKEANFVYKHIKTDWIFWGFADELVSKNCLKYYLEIAKKNKYKIVIQKKKTFLFDSISEFAPCDVSINFFRKDALNFSNNTIHQMGKFSKHVKSSDVLYLPPIDEYSIFHFSRYITENLISNFNKYSSIHAKTTSSKFLNFRLITLPIYTFLSNYFLLGGFKYGMRGIMVSTQFAIYTFLTLSKVYENKHNINLESIEENFVLGKKKLIAKKIKTGILSKIYPLLKIQIISRLHKYYKFKQLKK